ncbi:MAG TPA: urea ABC transporter permease subunit UrtB [Candidatus Paceibacterota bacterium]|nr:urea ABC transporter permease subunit UrtB [Candidatus Paceibacterota bacterium]
MKRLLTTILLTLLAVSLRAAETEKPEAEYRAILVQAATNEDATVQIELIKQLVNAGDDLVSRALSAWRVGELYLYTAPDGLAKIPFVLDAQQDGDGKAKGINVSTGEFIKDTSGKPLLFLASDLTAIDNSSKLRKAIKTTLDLFAIGNPVPKMRRDAVVKLGQEQNPEYLSHFEKRLEIEKNPEVATVLREAIALTKTADSNVEVRDAAIKTLGEMRSINGLEFLKEFQKKVQKEPSKYSASTITALRVSIKQIEDYVWLGNVFGTAFRGLGTAAVLLIAALGLAITFGLMGVINMAHGEVMAVGSYTAYMVQGIFGSGLLFSLFGKSISIKGFGLSGGGFDCYFIVALLASFVTAALVGLALERGVIRFLYKRPLESLLATWGVSLVLQQIFRHTFGAANVQVDSPSFLSGSFAFHGSPIGYNRIFVITFALLIVLGTYLLLTKTSLGLQIRAVMQNRAMASCMGVRTDRVNMMTFMFGSGLAGMAGCCMSQIANVGPSLGQNYIVDCFMVVVLGGVGNLVGTVSASLGIGVTNQVLEPWLGAVLGKILVLAAIILFLQWRPNGLFVTRSRSLDG